MHPLPLALLLPACIEEGEVCATADGLACDEAVARVADLEAAVADLQAQVAALQTGAGCVLTENPYAGETIADPERPLAVLAALDACRIGRDVEVTLSLAAATFTFDAPLRLAHPDGGRIRIEGAGVANTFLEFPESDGVVIEGASALGFLGGLTLKGQAQTYAGLTVQAASAATLGDLTATRFATGITVRGNAAPDTEEGSVVRATECETGVRIADLPTPGVREGRANSWRW